MTSVAEGSEAEKSGLLPGDVIISVDERDTLSASQLRNQIGIRRIGDVVEIGIIREGKNKSFKVKVGEPIGSARGGVHTLLEGIGLQNNNDGQGVVVTRVTRDSKGAYAGLRVDDVIVGANRNRVDNMRDLKKALSRSNSEALLLIQRGRGTFYTVIE